MTLDIVPFAIDSENTSHEGHWRVGVGPPLDHVLMAIRVTPGFFPSKHQAVQVGVYKPYVNNSLS